MSRITSDNESIASEKENFLLESVSGSSLGSENSVSFLNLLQNSEPIEISLSQLSDSEN